MVLMSRRILWFGSVALVAIVALATTAFLLPQELEAKPVYMESGIAIDGTDPVAYFTEQKPVSGSSEFATEWNGATWYFASAENRDLFISEPEAYAPQYGGFCAWAVATKSALFSTQPENWRIVDGKLYLNYNDDVQSRWQQNIDEFIVQGDQNWPSLIESEG